MPDDIRIDSDPWTTDQHGCYVMHVWITDLLTNQMAAVEIRPPGCSPATIQWMKKGTLDVTPCAVHGTTP